MGLALVPTKPNLVEACSDNWFSLDWDICQEMLDIRVLAYLKWSNPRRQPYYYCQSQWRIAALTGEKKLNFILS
jgi:hypothetical protein